MSQVCRDGCLQRRSPAEAAREKQVVWSVLLLPQVSAWFAVTDNDLDDETADVESGNTKPQVIDLGFLPC
jgi:hypothetical protein